MNPKNKKQTTPKGESKPLTLKDYQDYCDKYFPRKRCPHPNCPENDRPEFPYEKCTLTEPIWISIPAGEHIHISCPVHAEGHILRGNPISWKKPKVTWSEEDFWKLTEPNFPRRENNLPDPDYSKIGKVWM